MLHRPAAQPDAVRNGLINRSAIGTERPKGVHRRPSRTNKPWRTKTDQRKYKETKKTKEDNERPTKARKDRRKYDELQREVQQ